MSQELLCQRISKGKSRSMYIATHLKSNLKMHKNIAHLDNPIYKVINDENNQSQENIAKGSTHAPRLKLDMIHLYLNKSMQGGLDTVNHQEPQISTQSKTKLVVVPISRILKENREICSNIKIDVKVMRQITNTNHPSSYHCANKILTRRGEYALVWISDV